MSPRSQEFMDSARERLTLAATALESSLLGGATSAAYYAMLYAARAALSERDLYAKTHAGTWNLFGETFPRFDVELLREARGTQRVREGADYDAVAVSPERGAAVVELAQRFVAAIEQMLDVDD